MTRGHRPGDRLDVAGLADELSASATPVREALHQLVGEGLVETRTGGGFHVPAVDEPGLDDLYAWSAEVLVLAIRRWTRREPALGEYGDTDSLADRTDALFLAIARRSANGEHARTVAALNARLHAARCVEPELLDGIEQELSSLDRAFDRRESASLSRLCSAYHRRRRRSAAAIVRLLYRAS